ncbi:DUF563 domain-containing protein [Tabrizicola sp. TH137]|uniref:glycosyltransferase family 61 protein n=1 Tax=Tabrizicola sp. TH137 TaxID=2067452 RepID=UPI0013046291|nr:glycosyltransferase family 61 protein [Tabrizicola sp. TH137]
MADTSALPPFAPDRPMTLRLLPKVTLVPWGLTDPPGARRAAALFDAAGQPIPEAECWRWWGEPITTLPDRDPAATPELLPGRWLFGGLFYGHFGHLLCESTARLWALDHAPGITGILFHPKLRFTHENRMIRDHLALFQALGLADHHIRAPQTPVLVEEMVIPEQGFGIGDMAAGRPQYRAFMRDRLSRAAPPEGPDHIYISRARLPSKRGSVLLETRIEALMEQAGYTIFHPQEHPLTVQLARYRAARRIVALDGSALHLAAMVLHPEAQVAILNRGPSQNIDDYLRQFRHFAGIDPARIDAVRDYWFQAGRRVIKRETHALLDLPAVAAALSAAGFLPPGTDWPALTEADITAAIADLETRAGHPMTRYPADPAHA